MRFLYANLLGLSLLAAVSCPAATYYVATNGNDTAAGTATNTAWLTIQKAASVMVAGDTCYVRGGTYRETVTPVNSGTPASPITYHTYSNEVVTINGAAIITNWTLDAGNVFKAAMVSNYFASPYNQSDQIFVDGTNLTLAKWPNVTTAANAYPSGNAPAVDLMHPAKSTLTSASQPRINAAPGGTNWYYITFTDTNLTPAVATNYYVGAEIYMQPNNGAWSWTQSGTIIAQTNNTLTMRTANFSGPNTFPTGSRYYLFNQRQMLDATGEWFHDKPNGLLYLWLPDGSNPTGHLVEAKQRDFAFNLNNRSNIVVRGFNLFACTITTDTAAGGNGIGYNSTNYVVYPWRGAGSGIASANNITLDGLNAKYLSHFTDVSGYFYQQWGQGSGIILSGSDCVLKNSTLQFSAGNGVTVLGQRNQVLNNAIYDVDYSSVDCSAINTGGTAVSQDQEIATNTVARCGRTGITPRGLKNSNTANLLARIHHNDISQCMIQDWDGGGIYTAGGDAKFLRMDHNIIHDMAGYTCSGIYMDYQKNFIIDHNVIWNVEWGIHLQGDNGGVVNGLCYNNTVGVKNTSGVPYGPFAFANNGGTAASTGSVIRNNILFCITPPTASGYQAYTAGYFTSAEFGTNLLWDYVPGSVTDPKFMNVTNFNYRLTAASTAAINKGTVIPSYVRDGVTVPAFNEAANGNPDLGAYEYPVTLNLESATFSVIAGNTNAWIDPGETIQEQVILGNGGSDLITNITALLATTNAGVTLITSNSTFPNLATGTTATNLTPYAYRLTKTLTAGTVLNFTLISSGNDIYYTNTFTRTVGLNVAGSVTTNLFFSTDVPKNIPDLTTIYSTNSVAGLTNVITGVSVGVRIDHTFDGDLQIALQHPDGTEVLLASQRGASGDNFGSTSGGTTNFTIFNDAALIGIASGTPPFATQTGYQPDAPLANLNGKTANGNWRLRVTDTAGGDTGTLLAWYVRVAAQSQPCQSEIYNNPPVASTATNTVPTNAPSMITLSASDVDGDPLTYTTNSFPAHGTLSSFNTAAGTLVYTPASGYSGSDSFTFSVNDGSTNSPVATAYLVVAGGVINTNHPPVASNATYTVTAGFATNLMLMASDVDGNLLSYTINSLPAHGALYGFNSTNGAATYLPSSSYSGSDSFSFSVSDGFTNSPVATVSFTVQSAPSGSPLVYEGFNYTAGPNTPSAANASSAATTNGVVATGTGLTGNWVMNRGGAANNVSGTALNGAGYSFGTLSSTGGRLDWTGYGSSAAGNFLTAPLSNSAAATLAPTVANKTIWMSAMIKPGTFADGGGVYLTRSDSIGDANPVTTFGIGFNVSGKAVLYYNNGIQAASSATYTASSTYWLVGNFTYGTSASTPTYTAANLWVFNAASGNPPATLGTPDATFSGSSLAGGSRTPYFLFIKTGSSLASAGFDEVRVGTNYASVSSLAVNGLLAPTNTFTASLNPSAAGTPVTFTATLSGGSGTPTGWVQFRDGTNLLGLPVSLNGFGTAALTTSDLLVGLHSISVQYGGDANYQGSTNSLTQTVFSSSPDFQRLLPVGLTGGTSVLSFLGIPGQSYALDRATNLATPILWSPQATNPPSPDGQLFFTNSTVWPQSYYRTRTAP